MDHRYESDTLGEISIPLFAYWGSQTERSRQNFSFTDERMPLELIHALALVKRSAAITNHRLGHLSEHLRNAIVRACQEIEARQWDDQFPLTIWQTGSGTQTNMNLNEVIANRANELLGMSRGSKHPIHPNDHVNAGQSSNDCFPTAMHIAIARRFKGDLLPILYRFHHELENKVHEFKDILKIGRTHLQDAVPMTLGQEFSGYAHQIHGCLHRIESALTEVYALAQGGTAVGTGLNCPQGFAHEFAHTVAELTGLPFRSSVNKFEALSSHDALVHVSGTLSVLAAACMKIANDIRFLASGPRCGLGELYLPENEPGSSIMPGKVNPTQCESLTMIAAQVMGNHSAVTFAGSQGHFELNVFKPMIVHNVLRSARLLGEGIGNFLTRCLVGIRPNYKQLSRNVHNSLMLVTALVPILGYEQAAKVAQYASQHGVSLKEAILHFGVMSEDAFERHIDPLTSVKN